MGGFSKEKKVDGRVWAREKVPPPPRGSLSESMIMTHTHTHTPMFSLSSLDRRVSLLLLLIFTFCVECIGGCLPKLPALAQVGRGCTPPGKRCSAMGHTCSPPWSGASSLWRTMMTGTLSLTASSQGLMCARGCRTPPPGFRSFAGVLAFGHPTHLSLQAKQTQKTHDE